MKFIKKILNPEKLSTFVFYSSILTFIIAFNFSDHGTGGWQQQFLPDLNGAYIVDMTFTDSLTGYAATTLDTGSNSYIIKTSNGGENWNTMYKDNGGRAFTRIIFLNKDTGFSSTTYSNGYPKLLKTLNGGNNWAVLNNPNMFSTYQDISIVSENEVWMCFDNAFTGGVYRTTNSGLTWENKYPPQLSNGPTKIYMINSRIGFISNGDNTQSYLKKTTSSGDSWFTVPNGYGWVDITFKDSLNGWRVLFSVNNVQKTTNGGLIWETILNASLGNPNIGVLNFDVIYGSTVSIWGVYNDGYYTFPNNATRWVIFRTTNNGLNWGYQLPDTSIRTKYEFINFQDSLIGWSYGNVYRGLHTVDGGDTVTIYTGISNNNANISNVFSLYQNYPNPFNPKTIISYELPASRGEHVTSFVKLKVFNLQGKEIKTLVNQRQNSGNYETEFDGNGYSSGVYFYSLFIDNERIDTKRMLLIK